MMIRDWFKNLKFEDYHPMEETLLACVDGELSAKETAQIRRHLENCWTCRAKLDDIEETIKLFVNFRSQIQNPLVESPPSNWSNFDRKISEISAELDNAKISVPNRIGFWQRFRQKLVFAEWSPLNTQIGIGTVAAVLIVALLWQLVGVRDVLAAEILENSIRYQKQKIEKVDQPVVYQKMRLERAGAKTINLETWHDTANSRYRHASADGRNIKRFINAAFDTEQTDLPADSVVREVFKILETNRMNPQFPLSAESFQTWHDSVTKKTDEVENSYSDKGTPFFVLKTSLIGDVEIGKITQAALTVRADDWHTEKLRISVKGENGVSVYEFVETAFEVLSLSSLNTEIFPRDPQPTQTETASVVSNANISSAVIPSPSPENNDNNNAVLTAQPSPSSVAPTAASVELEIEVLRLLSRIDADIGQEATVKRNSNGELLIQGIVESRERKAEILDTLASVKGQPGLILQIETSQEAQKRIERERTRAAAGNRNKRTDNESVSIQPIEIRNAIPADAEVRRYLRSKGTPEVSLTGEVNRFATATLNRSNRILLRTLALKDLANRFSEVQLRSMKSEAKNEWLNLIATRVREIENQNATLRQELGTVFGGSSKAGGGVEISDEADLKRAVIKLSNMAAGNDRAIRAAFTFSSGANSDAVKGSQFRQSLNSIEGLANSIESAVRKLKNK